MNSSNKISTQVKRLKDSNYGRKVKIRTMRLKKNPNAFSIYFDVWINGKHDYRFLGRYITGDKVRDDESVRIALSTRDKMEAEYYRNETGYAISNWKGKSDFLEYFRIMAKGKGHHTWQSTYNYFTEFLGDRKTLRFNQIDNKLIEAFSKYLIESLGDNTAWLYLSKIKACLNQAVKDDIIDKNPARNVSIRQKQTEKVFLEIDEITTLENTDCQIPEVKRAFLFACHTGLRMGDVKNLEWKNIAGDKLSIRQQKTSDLLVIPLSNDALRLLGEPATGKVFDLPSPTYIGKMLNKWAQDAGIGKHIGFHTARHTFAVNSLEMDIDIYTLSKLLGHARLDTTQVYARIVDKRKEAAIAKRNAYWDRIRNEKK
jgi:integrase